MIQKFWLEIDEQEQLYERVVLVTDEKSHQLSIVFEDQKTIVLSKCTFYFTQQYLHVIGFLQISPKTYQQKGFYFYNKKPRKK